MPVYEVVTSEIVLTKYHVNADTEDEAIERFSKGVMVSQKVTWPDIEQIEVLAE